MTIADAVAAQPDFDAVMTGSATDDQCATVVKVADDLRAYLQEAILRAKALPVRRDAYMSLLSPAARMKVAAAVGIEATVEAVGVAVKA